MLQVFDLSKSHGSQVLFDSISFALGRGERVGLVGRNGHGKSTLFRLILGEEDPDAGRIMVPTRYRIGHLEQHLKFSAPTVLAEGCLGLPADERDLEYKAEAVLSGLGFVEEDLARSPAELSGGFQIRLNLAKLLLSEPDLLLLDEPTNYLDIVSVRWLERFLRTWRNELIVITHDREFMDRVTTHTMGIHRQKVRKIKGDTQKLYDQLLQEEEVFEKTRLNEVKKRKEVERFIERFRYHAAKANLVQSRVKLLDKMPGKEELARIESLEFRFTEAPFNAKTMIEVQKLAFGYPTRGDDGSGGGSAGRFLMEDLSFSIESGDRIGVIGRNGKGKSTLLKLIAGELEPVFGHLKRHGDIRAGYFGQTNISRLDPSLTVEEEVQSANNNLGRTQVRGICGAMMFAGDRAEKKVSVLSGGEKSRTLLGKILAQPSNMLLLDEPTSHLDIDSIEALMDSLREYSGSVVIVTHSELILREVATKLVYFRAGTVGTFGGGYEDFLERIGWDNEQEVLGPY